MFVVDFTYIMFKNVKVVIFADSQSSVLFLYKTTSLAVYNITTTQIDVFAFKEQSP